MKSVLSRGGTGAPARARTGISAPLKQILTALLIISLMLASPAFALTLTAEVVPAVATIGDRIQYTITARDAAGVELPLALEHPEPFEVLDTNTEGTDKIVFTLTVFQTGRLKLPSYSAAGITAPETFVTVRSVLPPGDKDPAMMPIEDVVDPEYYWGGILWPLGSLAALIAAAFAYQYWKNRRPEKLAAPAPGRMPFETALAELKEVERLELYTNGGQKEYFSRIADAVRAYLRDEYGIDAIEMTTAELQKAWPAGLGEHRERVFYLMRMCDLAKFTTTIPTHEDAVSTLATALYFIEQSPKEKSAPPPAS